MYCIDAGSEYCPCHLAETNDCILCSQLSGEEFCQCKDWCGVCIYEQYISNGKKAKNLRKTYDCPILDKKVAKDSLCMFTLEAPENLVRELSNPGSFVFLRNKESVNYYDVPISIINADNTNNTLDVAIKSSGTKTKVLFKLNKGDKILLRGPFSNGIMGLSNISNAKDGISLIIARGIGIAPSIPVMKKLYSNKNKLISIIDTQFKENFYEDYFKGCKSKVLDCTILDDGNLSEKFKLMLKKILRENSINLVHCGGPDIMSYKIIDFIDKINSSQNKFINFSCCNNSKMSCGEGICASCTKHYDGDIVRRLCKVQMDPRDLFKGRRLL
ncbi:sulfide/dihydroorotate dehydrogenase-like FAD/NAD-binding protein [Clostridium sp. AWRP]|uniref:sulfide/dihydroorotate dehydrogenase-like FAD/NAD-binding protein n=1 Tax=Clostridium sp. AWRP TaxID=2212991 RepID=UPI000FDC4C3E|nr:sulfide/dihydroorotate dehydrogenase-like FAD/NAD-binding protein [Clostridium sp. AWRP]AZV56822.1 sulfide/dihydroorotate dehydrogenase-like FAD/NAD-binding protein [Clostridium sp. AWRP]